jgi:hypothetical protein
MDIEMGKDVLPMMLSVIAAAAPPLVIIVFSSCGDDLCGAKFCPAVSDCADDGGEAADDGT